MQIHAAIYITLSVCVIDRFTHAHWLINAQPAPESNQSGQIWNHLSLRETKRCPHPGCGFPEVRRKAQEEKKAQEENKAQEEKV